jgi:Bacterial RNA polymerase, alpha chain C terminal domain
MFHKCPRCGYETPDPVRGPYEYNGYLNPHLKTILQMLYEGKESREISEAIGQGDHAIPMINHIRGRYGIVTRQQRAKWEKTERNAEITKRYFAGEATITDMAEIYGISKNRISQIIIKKRQQKEGIDIDLIERIEDVPIDTLELTARTHHALLDFKTVGEAMKMSDRELLRTPNFGKLSLAEWKLCLLSLKREFSKRAPLI